MATLKLYGREQVVRYRTDDTDNSNINRSELIEKYRKEGKVIQVEAVTLIDLLDKENAPSVIDYFSLDVEGAEERVLRGFDFNKYIFSALTIERPSQDLNRLLFSKGYVFVKNVRFDTFYVYESFDGINRIKKVDLSRFQLKNPKLKQILYIWFESACRPW